MSSAPVPQEPAPSTGLLNEPEDAPRPRTGEAFSDQLQAWFGHLPLEIDDLFLLERFQLLYLPERAPLASLGAVLAAMPHLRRFIATRCPELTDWLAGAVDAGSGSSEPVGGHARALVWEIADLLVYQRFPEAYDALAELRWDADQLADVCELEGRTIIDAGAGSGWLSEDLARSGRVVFAVEPVGRLREYIRQRADRAALGNLFVLDGLLHRIPLPASSADVLVTSRAIGWQLADELVEIERVVRPGGWAIHSVGTPDDSPRTELDERLEASGYAPSRYRDAGGWRRRYARRFDGG
ncbi:MAG: class I SAM-dependent methyltransferase [Alphaproteobacteria bacterium]|nr:class I SAM-dependent methyltransferase [Alphaproteobacteria bacterium]